MIVPMKKVSLIILGDKKSETLKKLRELGLMHIEMTEGSGERINELKGQISMLENSVFSIEEKIKKNTEVKDITVEEALLAAREVTSLTEEKKAYQSEQIALNTELDRLKGWGDIDPEKFSYLAEKGIDISLYEIPKEEYEALGECVKTIKLEETKSSVKCLLIKSGTDGESEAVEAVKAHKMELPKMSTSEMREKVDSLNGCINSIDEKIISYAGYIAGMKNAVKVYEKEIEFEVYATGMTDEVLSSEGESNLSVAHFTGYIEAENLDCLKQAAESNSWGLVVEEPTEEDNVPTKLKNNKFVSLIYPLTDFLNVVPGYYEYDISGWFLAFILIFFGMIFGDGGYGLLITAVAAVPIVKSLASKKPVPSVFLLIGLFGLSTIIWGTLTCTWFGLTPEQLPQWLKGLSVPVISNVYADKIWYPFWTEGKVGLTTAQNLQIFCFLLALIQLLIAHVKCAVTNRKSLKVIGDIGAAIELVGMFYMVLSFVVSAEVFSFGLVINGIPVGTISIVFIAVGFLLSFVFANYEGSIVKSILSSLVNIVSVLLGIFNLFSDIVSYIRLWAVGLAGAAISATVNELAGPLFGNFMFMILAIVLLVFGHGLNMILNVLSVIVHGIRLNTLEFSSHLGMSWSGYKFKPFEE
ncbi:MAG: ATPase [Ruminococcaceae bacterium]|nr:ATPase [Oscillospiraceae bacterium]